MTETNSENLANAHVELRESKKRLQLALKAARLGVWEWNLTDGSVFWSPECYQLVNVDTFGGRIDDFEKMVHPDDHSRVMNAATEAIEQHKNFDVEFRIIDPVGNILWLSNHGTVEYDPGGSPIRLIGTVQDITDKKLSETRIRESEQNFRALVQASTHFTWTADKDGSSEELFDWFSRLSGRTISDVEGIADIVHPDDIDNLARDWQKALETATLFSNVSRYRTAAGDYCYIAARAVQVMNEDGSFRQWIGTFNDITERMLVENAVRKHEAQLQLIANKVPTLIAHFDASQRCVFANEAFIQWLGRRIDNTVGHHASEIFGPEVYARILPEFEHALAGNTFSLERVSFADETRFLRFSYVPDHGAEGEVVGFFAFTVDLTESKQAEERLRASEEQLRQSQKLESIGRLAGGIAHDFNNMLTAINGYSELALMRLDADDPIRRNIEEIKKAGERSAALTNQLLAFSRRQLIERKILNVNQVITDSLVMLKRLIGEDVLIETDLDDGIWNTSADAGQLTQILLNLIVNSRDAMPGGGRIALKTSNAVFDESFVAKHAESKVGEYTKIAVSDTGTGIDDETIKYIFEPFFTTKPTGKGTGLGLSMVYGSVKQLEGYILVKANEGPGTTFEIYLPRALAEPDSQRTPTDGKSRNVTETILLVEDELIVRELSRQLLESCGYRVVDAADGKEALEIFTTFEGKIDLLLTDVVMPEMSGRELADQLTALQPDLKILFASGYIEDTDGGKGPTHKIVNFIQKPFTQENLSRKIRDIFGSTSNT